MRQPFAEPIYVDRDDVLDDVEQLLTAHGQLAGAFHQIRPTEQLCELVGKTITWIDRGCPR